MFGIGIQELIIILVIVLVLFGGKKLPEMARGIGDAVKEFRKGLDSDEGKKEKDKDEKNQED